MSAEGGRIFLVNVGVNARHGAARSPLFADGSFEWVPIPEDPRFDGPHSLQYRDLPRWTGPGTLAGFVPQPWTQRAAHADPDFVHGTYGDECQRTARARGLRAAVPGDWLFFLSRLVPWAEGRWVGPPCFALVGALRVTQAIHDLRSLPVGGSARLAKNAHCRRGRNNPAGWDGFSIFVGGAGTGRFREACVVDKSFAARLLRDAQGHPFAWPAHRTPLQVIGSYTRTCRLVLDPARRTDRRRYDAFWRHLAPYVHSLAPLPGC